MISGDTVTGVTGPGGAAKAGTKVWRASSGGCIGRESSVTAIIQFEEEAIVSYTAYLAEIESGRVENVAAPQIATDYWELGPNARLKDVVVAVRADEVGHRDVNRDFADALAQEG